MRFPNSRLAIPATMLALLIATPAMPALAQSTSAPALPKQYIFPAKDQTPEQQQKDEKACGTWATDESGFDPAKPPAPPPPPQPGQVQQPQQASAGRTAVKGAAAGYIIGDLANDEGGEGAAIGAAVGVASARRKNKGAQQAAQSQQQGIDQQYQQQLNQYNANLKADQEEFLKARTACLEAKGYTVK